MSFSIGLVGAGAIGGYLAAHLIDAGAQISILARPRTGSAIRSEGLRVATGGREIVAQPAAVREDPLDIGPVDLLIFTVKGQDTRSAAEAMRPMVGPDTRILTFQNGLYGAETLADLYAPEQVLAGVTYVPAVVEAPGRIRHTGAVTRFVFGPLTGGVAPRIAQDFAALGQQAGLDMVCMDEPGPEIWAKFVMLTPFHLVSCLTRGVLGNWIDVHETRGVYVDAMREVTDVAQACGVTLPEGLVERNLAFSTGTADRGTRASMLDDLERGKPLELDATVGWLLATADRVGVEVPLHRMGYALVKPWAAGRDQVA